MLSQSCRGESKSVASFPVRDVGVDDGRTDLFEAVSASDRHPPRHKAIITTAIGIVGLFFMRSRGSHFQYRLKCRSFQGVLVADLARLPGGGMVIAEFESNFFGIDVVGGCVV